MSLIDYIDLSETDSKQSDKYLDSNELNGSKWKKSKFPFRPKTLALQCIGLSLIRMQYSDKLTKTQRNIRDQNGVNKQKSLKSDVWNSVWIDDQNPWYRQYPLRHMLEYKFEKSCKCPYNRSIFCQCPAKMARINWIHHVRRGHLRIDYEFKKALKRNSQNGISNIFEVFCVLCNKSRKFLPISPNEFIQHMKKLHPNFLPYTDYFTYFQRCYICNDETKSFQQNVYHRQMCLAAVNKEPNQIGTSNFNNCFKALHEKSIISVELESDPTKSFESKMKFFIYKRTTFNYWLARKKIDSRQSDSIVATSNGHHELNLPKSIGALTNSNKHHIHISQFLPPAPIPLNSIYIESERIPPGASLDFSVNSEKFFVPVPFPIRSETKIRESYNEWSKLVDPRHSKLAKVNPWFCELCNAMIKNTNTAYSHLKICHAAVPIVENQCKSCDKRFFTLHGFKKHFQDFKLCPVARKCGICGLSIPVNDIYNHLFDMHKNNFSKVLQLTTCLICRGSVTDIKKHLFDAHDISNALETQPDTGFVNYRSGSFFNCTKCAMTYFSEIDLRNHMISNQHHFECSKCPEMKFYSFWHLANHRISFHSDEMKTRDLFCEICSNKDDDNRLEKTQFSSASEKVDHFLKLHNSHCHVVLTKIESV